MIARARRGRWALAAVLLVPGSAAQAPGPASPRFLALVAEARQRVEEISPQALFARLQGGAAPPIVIDVREDSEWAAGHLPDAVHLCRGVLERDIETWVPDLDEELVLYCGSGARSLLAADSLRRMGYTRVRSLRGGYRAWVQADLPAAADP